MKFSGGIKCTEGTTKVVIEDVLEQEEKKKRRGKTMPKNLNLLFLFLFSSSSPLHLHYHHHDHHHHPSSSSSSCAFPLSSGLACEMLPCFLLHIIFCLFYFTPRLLLVFCKSLTTLTAINSPCSLLNVCILNSITFRKLCLKQSFSSSASSVSARCSSNHTQKKTLCLT